MVGGQIRARSTIYVQSNAVERALVFISFFFYCQVCRGCARFLFMTSVRSGGARVLQCFFFFNLTFNGSHFHGRVTQSRERASWGTLPSRIFSVKGRTSHYTPPAQRQLLVIFL